MSEY